MIPALCSRVSRPGLGEAGAERVDGLLLASADPATVATQLSSAETQNQALMSVIATVEKQSLFDMIQ